MTLDLNQTSLGIELGSTRIKAVLIGPDHQAIATGGYGWESRFENGLWTYDLENVWKGLQAAYKELQTEVQEKFGEPLTKVGSIGFSAMMHGYLAFDKEGEQLTPFRTWQNTNTQKAAEALTSLFEFNIPLRWSVAHIYQAILDKEAHVSDVDFMTTLSGYVHWRLTGERVLGIGDASGMFPIDSEINDYHAGMMEQFGTLIKEHQFPWSLGEVLPIVKTAGESAGYLTEAGAKLLDPSGTLQAGIPLCAPEGDAGTGMVATNTVAAHTGNVSAGTSIFSMIVLEEALSNYYMEIDMVTTPAGNPVAMVHCNNFTSDINAWASLFSEVLATFGKKVTADELYTTLFESAMMADADVGGLVNCNYYSGEPITGLEAGRPLFARMPDSKLTLPNFMLAHIYSALATLEIGMEILTNEEDVKVDYILGHGGFFKTENVGQQLMADVLRIPTTVMDTAGEGGAWGMALLATFMVNREAGQILEDYLEQIVFAEEETKTIEPTEEGIANFRQHLARYKALLQVERTAVEQLKL